MNGIIHDLIGENCKEKQTESVSFLDKIAKKCDKIIVLKDSPLVKKSFSMLMKNNDPLIRKISKNFQNILWNSNKCIMLEQNELKDVQEEIANKLRDKEDLYLLKLLASNHDSILVTSDSDLLQIHCNISSRIKRRDDFLKEYLQKD